MVTWATDTRAGAVIMCGLRRCLTVLILEWAMAVAAMAQSVGDPQKGFRLAQLQCADCHFVERGLGRSPVPPAPSFKHIANIPGMTNMALTTSLRTSHATMPNVVIKGSDISDLEPIFSV